MTEKKINVMKDKLRVLKDVSKSPDGSLKMDNDSIRLSSNSKWKSNFLIDYILFSNEFFNDLMNELEFKNKLIENLEGKLKDVSGSTDKEMKKHHRAIVRKLRAEFNKLPIKNRIYKKMLVDWLSVNLR